MALPREISSDLFVLCDALIEAGEEGVESAINDLGREQLQSVLAEAVRELVDASFRADKEIERFQRRLAERRES